MPIEVTLFGMVIEVSEVALKNALSPIEVTLFGMIAVPAQLAPDVTTELTTLLVVVTVIVKVPPPEQFTV